MSEEATLDEFVNPEREVSEETEQPELIQGVAWSIIKSVPEEWTVNNVESDIDILSGNNFSSEYFVEEGGIPLIRIRDLAEDDTTVNFDGEYDSRYLINQQDLLVGMDGEFEPHLWAGPQALLNQRVCKIEPKSQYNKIFFRYAIEKPLFYIQKSIAGTTVKHLSQSNINDLNLLTPPLSEQRKIATVLHTVDRAIEIADNISDQVERVEQGLQQTLFTGEHLNCERKEAPTIGQVPVDWQIKTMGNVCNITMGSSPKSEHYNESGDGLPFFQANNEFGLRNPKHDRWCSNPVKTANKGDSLMTLRGTYVGQMNIADRECCIGRGLAGISAGEELLEEYLYQHLRRRERYVKSIAIGSTFDSVSSSELENLPIVIPPKEEQREIAETLKSVQERLKFTKEYTEQLHRLKHGLMQDLLSGTVRTTDTNIEVPEEIAKYG